MLYTGLPKLDNHVYWDQKEKFMLNQDTYEVWVLFAVEQGSFRYRIGEQEDVAQFGDLVLCPPHMPFERETISPLSFHFFTFHSDHKGDNTNPAELPWGKIKLPLTERLKDNYTQLRQKDRFDPILLTPIKQHLFMDIWFMILQEKQLEDEIMSIPQSDPLMQRAASMLQEQAYGQLSMKEIAMKLQLSSVQFTRKFQAAYRVNPLQYLTAIRLYKACALLAETHWTLDQIASECGYENGFYLSRLLSKHMNMSPSTYRKNHQI